MHHAIVPNLIRIPPFDEKSGITFWMKVRPARVEPPPFAIDDDPRFGAESDELLGGTLLGNVRNGLWTLGKV